jgi:hypothetical protein
LPTNNPTPSQVYQFTRSSIYIDFHLKVLHHESVPPPS